MKIAVEKRGDRWLVKVVNVGENLHWFEHRVLQNSMIEWIDKNLQYQVDIEGWQFFFHNEQDLEWFLLRWS